MSISKSVVKETRDLAGFTKVNFGVSGNLYINLGKEFKVVLEGEQSLLENIETNVSGSGSVNYMGSPRVDARVSGSGRVRSN
ncbi:MAG: hypothetical protein Q7J06_05895 [Bacteroidales bacterium]|nr:hypothetical protein [Bacteroidales bacterium]